MFCIVESIGTNLIVCSNVLALTQLLKVICVHNEPTSPVAVTAAIADLKCAVALCGCHFQTVKELLLHLKEHIVDGRAVSCPVIGCTNMFSVKSSFTAHMSRKHKGCSSDRINYMYKETPSTSSAVIHSEDVSQSTDEIMAPTDITTEQPENFSDSFLRNVSFFTLNYKDNLLFLLPQYRLLLKKYKMSMS